jgi:hypothetical protein
MLLLPAPQKFNTFNTFTTFTIFTPAPIASAAAPSGTTPDPVPSRPPTAIPPSPCVQGRVPTKRVAVGSEGKRLGVRAGTLTFTSHVDNVRAALRSSSQGLAPRPPVGEDGPGWPHSDGNRAAEDVPWTISSTS